MKLGFAHSLQHKVKQNRYTVVIATRPFSTNETVERFEFPPDHGNVLQECSFDPKFYMLKSMVRMCDITRRRMPQSFMVRFVSSAKSQQADSQHQYAMGSIGSKLHLVPNLTSTDKMMQFMYCYANKEAIAQCEANSKKYQTHRLRDKLKLEFKRVIYSHIDELIDKELVALTMEDQSREQLENNEVTVILHNNKEGRNQQSPSQKTYIMPLFDLISNKELGLLFLKRQQQLFSYQYDRLINLNKVRSDVELSKSFLKPLGKLPEKRILKLRFKEQKNASTGHAEFVIEESESGLNQQQISIIEKATEYYAGKYKDQKPWVTVEGKMYTNMDTLKEISQIMAILEKEENYKLYLKASLKTNYLYQYVYKYGNIYH